MPSTVPHCTPLSPHCTQLWPAVPNWAQLCPIVPSCDATRNSSPYLLLISLKQAPMRNLSFPPSPPPPPFPSRPCAPQPFPLLNTQQSGLWPREPPRQRCRSQRPLRRRSGTRPCPCSPRPGPAPPLGVGCSSPSSSFFVVVPPRPPPPTASLRGSAWGTQGKSSQGEGRAGHRTHLRRGHQGRGLSLRGRTGAHVMPARRVVQSWVYCGRRRLYPRNPST